MSVTREGAKQDRRRWSLDCSMSCLSDGKLDKGKGVNRTTLLGLKGLGHLSWVQASKLEVLCRHFYDTSYLVAT